MRSYLTFLFTILMFSCRDDSPEHQVIELDRPIEVSATKGDFGNKIVVSWIQVPKVSSYQVYRFSQPNDEYIVTAETDQNYYEDTNLDSGPYEKVFYKVKSFNSEFEYSGFSDVAYGYRSGKNYDLILQFGSEGNNDGQFKFPEHIAIDANNNIYVSDTERNVIQRFTNDGNFVDVFYTTPSPRGMIFLADGRIVIARSQQNIISVFDKNLQVIKEWGSMGTQDGQFTYFRQIAVDDELNLYVVDMVNNRVQKFDLNGKMDCSNIHGELHISKVMWLYHRKMSFNFLPKKEYLRDN